ncbi:Fibrocystin [Manis pentadactyla]|nr:Fibrocystin [Manis pentadactyla]
MELCTLTPSRVRLHLFCRQPTSVSDEPPSGPHRDLLPASRSTVSVSLGSPHITLPFRMSLFGPPQRSSARFSFHCLRVLGFASDHGIVDPETPHKKILILLQHVSAPPCQRGDRERWPLDGTLHPDTLRVRLHLFCRHPTSVSDEPHIGPPQRSSARFSFHCLRVLGMRLTSRGPEQWPLDGTLHPDTLTRAASSSADSRVDPETPHKKILILLQHVSAPMPTGTGSSGCLMELCTLTPSRVRLHLFCRQPTSISDEPHRAPTESSARFSFHCLRVIGLPQIKVYPETPQKKILILLQHVYDPHANGDREQWPLDGTLHPDTLTPSVFRMSLLRAPTEIFCHFSFHCLRVLGIASDHGATSSLFQLHALRLYPLSLVLEYLRRHPTENADSSATHLGPHASRDREQWPLDGTLHPDTLTCGFTSSADSRVSGL